MHAVLTTLVYLIFAAGLWSVYKGVVHWVGLLFFNRDGDSGRYGHFDENERIR